MNPYRTSLLAVSLCLAVAGCINLPDIDPGEPELPDLGVRLLTPGATTYTNGTVDVSVEVTNGAPETVELFAGDELLATLTPPYTFRWDTTTKPEGTYTLTAEARRGPQNFTSEAREVVVDRTPPQVLLVTPESGASGVKASHPIQAVFSEALDPASTSNSSVRMKVNGSEVDVRIDLSSEGKLMTINPAAAVTLPARVDVVLTGGLRDRAGNSIIQLPGGWSWDVPDFFFVERVLRIDGRPALNPSLQLDALGRPFVACPAGDSVYVQYWTGNSWEPLNALKANPGGAAYSPSLQLDSAARPVVAWVEVSSSSTDVYVGRWTGSNWEIIGGALSEMPGDTPAGLPSLQLDAAGNPIVAFGESDGLARNLYVKRWNGSAWELVGGALSAKPGYTQVTRISLRLDLAGNPVVAWMEPGEDSLPTAYVSRWSNGQWTMLGSVLGPDPGSNFIDGLSLALDDNGNPVIGVFRKNAMTSSRGLYVLQWTGEQWRALGEALTVDAFSIALQTDVGGYPTVAWTWGNPASDVYVKRWTGTVWESLGRALSAQPSSSSAYSPSLQLNADGYPVVAWSETLNSDGGVYVAYFNY